MVVATLPNCQNIKGALAPLGVWFWGRSAASFWIVSLLSAFSMIRPAFAAVSIPFTVNTSEAVTVDTTGGTPRIAVDVGGNTRYATYTAGSGTSALTFTLSPTVGDVDLDGVAVSSPIDLNGGTIKDSAGNNAALTFTPPNTSGIKVDYPSLSMDFINNDYILSGTHYNTLTSFMSAAGGSFTRASTATYFDSTGTMQTAASGAPRFDYDPVTHTAKGILIEESRINRLTYSDQFDNAIWNKSFIGIFPNVVSGPDGTQAADEMKETAGAGMRYFLQDSSITNGATYTQTIYAKANTRSFLQILSSSGFDLTNTWANFNLSTGTIGNKGSAGTASISSVGNGWYRCSLTATATSGTSAGRFVIALLNADTNARLPSYTGDGVSSIYVWGAQLEQGTAATSYIPTTSVAVTRDADTLTVPTGPWYNATKGLMFGQASAPVVQNSTYRRIASLNDGNVTNSVSLMLTDASPNLTTISEIISGGVGQFSSLGGTYSAGSAIKQAVTYDNNYARSSVMGVLGAADTSVTVPTASAVYIGTHSNTQARFLDGNVAVFKYYPARVADTQVQLLTQ